MPLRRDSVAIASEDDIGPYGRITGDLACFSKALKLLTGNLREAEMRHDSGLARMVRDSLSACHARLAALIDDPEHSRKDSLRTLAAITSINSETRSRTIRARFPKRSAAEHFSNQDWGVEEIVERERAGPRERTVRF